MIAGVRAGRVRSETRGEESAAELRKEKMLFQPREELVWLEPEDSAPGNGGTLLGLSFGQERWH